MIDRIAQALADVGGCAWVVGGTVRDTLLRIQPHDIDVEVYNLTVEKIIETLSVFGQIDEVGRSFGILKLKIDEKEYDVSLPRSDSKVADGHKGFIVNADPFMSPKEAARRRDFTINAIMYNPLTGEFFDPFGGMKDLHNRVLRIVDPITFKEDPLRILRAMQFISRFNLTVDPDSMEYMKGMLKCC